MHYNSDKG